MNTSSGTLVSREDLIVVERTADVVVGIIRLTCLTSNANCGSRRIQLCTHEIRIAYRIALTSLRIALPCAAPPALGGSKAHPLISIIMNRCRTRVRAHLDVDADTHAMADRCEAYAHGISLSPESSTPYAEQTVIRGLLGKQSIVEHDL